MCYGELKKMPNKWSKNCKKYTFKNKYQSVTHASKSIFQGLFKYVVNRSVSLVTKKLWANF